MSDWIDIGVIADIPLRGSRTVQIAGLSQIAVFRTSEDRVFALLNQCPHKKGPLSQGIVHGNSVACPLHNWNIALATGQAEGADEGCTPVIPVMLDEGRVHVCRATTMLAAAA